METPLSHLAHLEITSPDVEASAKFYEEKFGMRIIDRVDGNVYLRCWGDYYHYSLVVTEDYPLPAVFKMLRYPHASAARKTMLAELADPVAPLSNGPWRKLTEHTITDTAQLKVCLEAIRDKGEARSGE